MFFSTDYFHKAVAILVVHAVTPLMIQFAVIIKLS